ncbi:MAG: hypothetical protein PHX27_04490 [Candidatus ainarchaeum sp.]|nr:hypothetical protein [Candidatus ainarchaeum sp.]
MAFAKDKLAAWFIQNFVVSKSQVFDNPGFISFKISGKVNAYSRQLIFSEDFFVNLEKKIDNQLGSEGNALVYSLGKKFGYRFAMVANAQQITNLSSLDAKNYIYLLTRFVEGTYSSGITHEIFAEDKMIKFNLDNFVICSKSGKGFFLSAGGIAGIWSKIIGLDDIEAVHYKCQASGDSKCEVMAAPKKILDAKFDNVLEETNLNNLNLDKDYFEINTIQPITNSSKSFKHFLDANIFSYNKGIIKMGDKRFFIIEASIIYLLESVLSVNKTAMNILKEISFELGFDLANNSNLAYITDLCSALGFGDLVIIKKTDSFLINFDYFPWTRFSKESDHIFISSFLSGMLSNNLKKEINLNLKSQGFFGKGYSVSFS